MKAKAVRKSHFLKILQRNFQHSLFRDSERFPYVILHIIPRFERLTEHRIFDVHKKALETRNPGGYSTGPSPQNHFF